jgi:hypothetical protein
MSKQRILANIMLLGFLLGIYEGKVALWKDHNPKPIKVFPYQASQLPEQDQKLLEEGVHVDSLGQLRKLIQDYFT